MTKTLIATLLLLSSAAFAGEPGTVRCDARELVPGGQGRSGKVVIEEQQASWESGADTSLCQLEEFSADACYVTRSSSNLVLWVSADCGEERFNIPMAEARLVLDRDHGRYSCIHRALGLKTELELKNCRAL